MLTDFHKREIMRMFGLHYKDLNVIEGFTIKLSAGIGKDVAYGDFPLLGMKTRNWFDEKLGSLNRYDPRYCLNMQDCFILEYLRLVCDYPVLPDCLFNIIINSVYVMRLHDPVFGDAPFPVIPNIFLIGSKNNKLNIVFETAPLTEKDATENIDVDLFLTGSLVVGALGGYYR